MGSLVPVIVAHAPSGLRAHCSGGAHARTTIDGDEIFSAGQ
jgi:hypothetical protein